MMIGELARRAGVPVQTVRYYERRGLLLESRCTASGYREYLEEAAKRLGFVRRAQTLGFTLTEIVELLALRVTPATVAAAVKVRAEAKIADVERRIRDLECKKDALSRLAERCRGGAGPVDACPLVDVLGSIKRASVIESGAQAAFHSVQRSGVPYRNQRVRR